MESNDDFDNNGKDDEWFVINPAGSSTQPKLTEGESALSDNDDDCDVGSDDGIPSVSVSFSHFVNLFVC